MPIAFLSGTQITRAIILMDSVDVSAADDITIRLVVYEESLGKPLLPPWSTQRLYTKALLSLQPFVAKDYKEDGAWRVCLNNTTG